MKSRLRASHSCHLKQNMFCELYSSLPIVRKKKTFFTSIYFTLWWFSESLILLHFCCPNIYDSSIINFFLSKEGFDLYCVPRSFRCRKKSAFGIDNAVVVDVYSPTTLCTAVKEKHNPGHRFSFYRIRHKVSIRVSNKWQSGTYFFTSKGNPIVCPPC